MIQVKTIYMIFYNTVVLNYLEIFFYAKLYTFLYRCVIKQKRDLFVIRFDLAVVNCLFERDRQK